MSGVAALLAAVAAAIASRPLARVAWALAGTPAADMPRRRWPPWACAAVAASLVMCRGLSPETAELAALSAVLVVATLADLDARLIPNPCVVAAALVRLGYLALLAASGDAPGAAALLADSLSCALVLLAALSATVAAMERLLGRPGMGGGDLKLLAVAGLYFGWRQCLPLVLVASLLGLAFGLAYTAGGEGRLGSRSFPFGPAIAVACWLTMLAGERAVAFLGL